MALVPADGCLLSHQHRPLEKHAKNGTA